MHFRPLVRSHSFATIDAKIAKPPLDCHIGGVVFSPSGY
jgi:hypothetical protein